MKIVGLDLSLNASGAASIDTSTGRTALRTVTNGKLAGHERLQHTLEELAGFVQDATLAVIEGPSYGSKGQQHSLAGNWWLVAHMLWRKRIPYAIVPPWTLKSYLTHRGNADKKLVMDTLRDAFPTVPLADDNQADAFGLTLMACRWKGLVVDAHLNPDLTQMEKAEWPDHRGQPRPGAKKAVAPRGRGARST